MNLNKANVCVADKCHFSNYKISGSAIIFQKNQGSKKTIIILNLPFGQASLKFHLPGQDFINCYFSLVHEQLVHILAHRASEWGKSLVRHKNLLVPDDGTGLFSSPEKCMVFHHCPLILPKTL